MLNHNDLTSVWETIIPDNKSPFYYKRINSLCIPDLCLGINSEGHRSLILELPENHGVDLQPIFRKNLVLKMHEKSLVVLELKTSDYNELFCDLVISLYQSICALTDVDEYSSIFVNTFCKWSEFFSKRDFLKLSDESIKGLFGEILLLSRSLKGADASQVDMHLSSWRGPYDSGKDFQFDELDIEVKTKSTRQMGVAIASEYQLDPEPGKDLQLCVISVEVDNERGMALSEIAFDVRNLVMSRFGDLSLFRNALWQKGLTLENISEYDHLKYAPTAISTFHASGADFPALISSTLHPALSKVRYQLNLSQLEKYLVEEIKL